MKKIVLVIILGLSFFGYTLTAQPTEGKRPDDKPEIIRDRLLIDVFHSFWMGMPGEVNSNKLNPGFNISAMWDFKSKSKSPFSFGLGLGVTYYSQFSDAMLQYDRKNDLMKYYVLPNDTMFKRNRVTYINCNIPLEFRYRHSNGFKVTVGVRVGIVAEISHLYRGNNPDGSINYLNRKSFEIYNKQKFNFDAYLRIGWKYVSLYYCYQLTPLFERDKGPRIMPMSLGFTWNLF